MIPFFLAMVYKHLRQRWIDRAGGDSLSRPAAAQWEHTGHRAVQISRQWCFWLQILYEVLWLLKQLLEKYMESNSIIWAEILLEIQKWRYKDRTMQITEMVSMISRMPGGFQRLFCLLTWYSSGQLRGTHCHTGLCHGSPPRNSMTSLCLFLWDPITIIPSCVTHSEYHY